MNEFLQVIGSLASILGVPLAVYLYLKSQVQRYAGVRREIVKRLSHQIGEGRAVGLFELNAVIDSLVRENRLKRGSIQANTVIEDLIAETVSSPLLDSRRKEHLIGELSKVHSVGKVFRAIESDNDIFKKFIDYLNFEERASGEADEAKEKIKNSSDKSKENLKTPELFGAVASVIAGVMASLSVAGITEGLNILPKILNSNLVTGVSLGLMATVLAAAVAALIAKLKSSEGP